MDSVILPGFLQLPLDVNSENFDYDDIATYKFPVLLRQLEDKLHRPEHIAIRNLLGYVAARLEWYVASFWFLNEVLHEDPDNLNALTNLKWVYEQMDGRPPARKYEIKQRLESILDNPERSTQVMKARCIAEQGYALHHGITNDYENQYASAFSMYDSALDMAGDLVSADEQIDWKLGRAKANQKLFTRRVNRNDTRLDDLDFQIQMIADIQEVLLHGDNHMKADSWVKLGSIFHGYCKRGVKHPSECLQMNRELLQCFSAPNPPLSCYNKALEFRPKYSPILVLKAQVLKNKHYEEHSFARALELLDTTIEGDQSYFNRMAFSVRAELFLDWYRMQSGRLNTDSMRLLINAKRDYETSIEMHAEHVDLMQLGEVWQHLSKDYTNERLIRVVGKTKFECLNMALQFFTLATETDFGSFNPYTHWKRAQCLSDMRDFDRQLNV